MNHRANPRSLVTLLICLAALAPKVRGDELESQRAFWRTHQDRAGLYRAGDQYLIIGIIPSAEIIYLERMSTGDMRFMRTADEPGVFRYSPTRNPTDEVEGTIAFRPVPNGPVSRLVWTDRNGAKHQAKRVGSGFESVVFGKGNEIRLSGLLVLPESDAPHPAVVLIPQSDRYDLWSVGMWLLSRGVAVLAYDRRNDELGKSTGPEVTGGYQDRQSQHARDLGLAVEYLKSRKEIRPDRIGIVGWSSGGFTGAFLAGRDHDLAFYVNIAGDASPGFEQVKHMFIARLLREGFSDDDVAAGRAFVELHYGVAEGAVDWQTYQTEIARVRGTNWYQFLSSRYSIPFTREEGVTEIGAYQAQWPPDRVYGRISSTPTLGVFFEFDHSSAPSSPHHFQSALRSAGNGNHAVVIVPDSNHSGFVVNGRGYRFDTGELTRRSPLLIDTVADWVERQVWIER